MPPRIVHLPLALAAGDVELAICPASELSRDASPNPSSENDLRLARQRFPYFVSASVPTVERQKMNTNFVKWKRTMEEEAVRRSEERVAALERRLQVCCRT